MKIRDVFAAAGKEELALVRDGPINYIVLNTKLNLITPHFIKKMDEFLDELDKAQGEGVLVTIGSGASCFSGGFDLNRWGENLALAPFDLIGSQKVLIKL